MVMMDMESIPANLRVILPEAPTESQGPGISKPDNETGGSGEAEAPPPAPPMQITGPAESPPGESKVEQLGMMKVIENRINELTPKKIIPAWQLERQEESDLEEMDKTLKELTQKHTSRRSEIR